MMILQPYGFQSTRPRGARHPFHFGFYPTKLFQSTRPRGARPEYTTIVDTLSVFQSTRPRGARLIQDWMLFADGTVSIHAPAWGATLAADRNMKT